MAKELIVNPGAILPARPGDIHLTAEEYLKLGLFAKLRSAPTVKKFPGTLVLRRYGAVPGEEIYRQGDPGWTAFYVLTSEEVLAVRQSELAAVGSAPPSGPQRDRFVALQREIGDLRERIERAKQPTREVNPRQVGNINVAIPRSRDLDPASMSRPRRRRIDAALKNDLGQTIYLPRDAANACDYDRLREPLCEGEVFGEMSCLYRVPRGETVVATRECYVLEMLRNIVDMVRKDREYKVQSDQAHKKHTLRMQMRKVSLFADLSDEQFEAVLPELDLVNFEPGQVAYDEFDPSLDVYVIRTGLVRVMKNVSSLLRSSHLLSARMLCTAILKGETTAPSPAGQEKKAAAQAKVWQLLPAAARQAVRAGAAAVGLFDGAEVVLALNELIKSRAFAEAKETKELLTETTRRENFPELPANPKEWSDQDVRRWNRAVLEALYPEGVGTAALGEGLPCILLHYSPGEFFGGQGVLLKEARITTCIADGHPNHDGLAALVRIPGPTFLKMLALNPAIKQKVEDEYQLRKKQMRERLLVPLWDDSRQVQLSEAFQELGFIQGRKLMLIDLDRCTRCDECVKACVNVHDDGRSRLFLDGPRFGRYLAPITCRSCLDPVCLSNCPVGSIHAGPDRQIVIENWCIGCGQCAENCPYGSIQMHDVGVIAETARDWRFLPASAVSGEAWRLPRFKDKQWLTTMGPILYDREFREDLVRRLKGQSPPELVAAEPTWCFRYNFDLPKEMAGPTGRFKLEITSEVKEVRLWVNGREAKPDKEQRGKREFYLSGGATVKRWWNRAADAAAPVFGKGRNVLAVQVKGKPVSGKTLMQLRLDEVKKPAIPQNISKDLEEEIKEKLVTEKAVVCDLCAALPQGPACVTACPHDAALRVNARSNFPTK